MNDNILWEAKFGGYNYVYDKEGFITVYDIGTEDKNKFIYSHPTNCESRKEFEMEIIYLSKVINELSTGT